MSRIDFYEYKYVTLSYIIPPNWYGTGSWDLDSCKTSPWLSYMIKITDVAILAVQEAMASAAMVLT